MTQRVAVLTLTLLLAGVCAGGLIETVDLVETADPSPSGDDAAGIVLTVLLNNDTALPDGAQVVVEYHALFADGAQPAHQPVQHRAQLAQGDADAERNVWRGVISTRNISQGALLQYRALVLGDGTVLDAAPAGLDASNVTSMYTWVVGFDAINASSPVPAMMWYTADPERARWDYPTPGSIAFDSGDTKLRFYSSVEVHREGSGRKDGNVRRSSQEVRARSDVVCTARTGCSSDSTHPRAAQGQGLAQAQVPGHLSCGPALPLARRRWLQGEAPEFTFHVHRVGASVLHAGGPGAAAVQAGGRSVR